jgi:small conductance mechanosensitive channel
MENAIARIQELITVYGLKIIAAIVILVIGRWVAKWLKGLVCRLMQGRKLDDTVVSFVAHLVYIGLMAFVVLAALGQLGIQTTSFIAVLGAAGLAIGLALQGSLSNFAAGFLIIIFKPFKAGDYVEIAGTAGVVEEIQIFTTQMRTPDNKGVIVPNSKILGDIIVNYNAKETRRVDLVVGVSYSADLNKVRETLQAIINAEGRIMQDPEPAILVSELADSSVNFAVRVWTKADDYWPVFFDMTETVKKRFDEEGIEIPFPQRDVHVYEMKQ